MAAVTIQSDFVAQENKSHHCFHGFPIYLPWHDRARCHVLSFWMLSFKPDFSLSSLTFLKRLFGGSLLSALGWHHLHIQGYWYFSKQSWFQLALHQAWHFTWCTLPNSYISKVKIYTLDILRSRFELVSCSTFGSNYCFLTCIQFSQRQVQCSGISISLRSFHILLWSTQSKTLV